MRKPFAVWCLLQGGQPWMYCQERTLDEAMKTARTLRGYRLEHSGFSLPMVPLVPVWIAAPARVALKPSRARYRRWR